MQRFFDFSRKESETLGTNCLNKLPKKMNEIELEFTKLVREYRKTIYTVCYFFSNNPTDVEDLFQEVLVNLWKGFAKFRGIRNAYGMSCSEFRQTAQSER